MMGPRMRQVVLGVVVLFGLALLALVAFARYDRDRSEDVFEESRRWKSAESWLRKASLIRCDFDEGGGANWHSDALNGVSSHARGESFGKDGVIRFDNIDLEQGTARMIGNAGADDVRAFATGAGLNFFEQTGSGSVILVTVFFNSPEGEQPGSGALAAVMSRHLAGLLGPPSSSQFYARCRVQQ